MNKTKKNYILGIESTGRIAGLSLICEDKVIDEINIDNGLTHSVTLFTNLEKLLKRNKITMSNIIKIKVSNGPGSFTGIRIGIACALGLSIKYKTKIEYVDTLKSLALNCQGESDYILSMIDAKADRIYLSIYKSDTMQRVLLDKIVRVDYLTEMLNKYFAGKCISFIFVGDAAKVYEQYFNNNLNIDFEIAPKENLLQKASSVAKTTGIISKIPLINYLQASKAERERYGQN